MAELDAGDREDESSIDIFGGTLVGADTSTDAARAPHDHLDLPASPPLHIGSFPDTLEDASDGHPPSGYDCASEGEDASGASGGASGEASGEASRTRSADGDTHDKMMALLARVTSGAFEASWPRS